MNPVSIIARKRDGTALTDEEIAFFIRGFTTGDIPDYQMSALAMAIYIRGMTAAETATLTFEMLQSGKQLVWDSHDLPTVDKHSTGGIGDKVSLILAPLVACCDVQVPMLSGRGLGPTGGTLDKLESIAGFRTDLSLQELQRVCRKVGCVITGTTPELTPADRQLYALRDVTATVASIPLITASIMSKKLAEGLKALVLDVKFGSGAFMKTYEQASALADSLVAVGQRMGVATRAVLNDMNQPLGRMAGNAVEVDEALDVLRGHGPTDLKEVTLRLSEELLCLAGTASTPETARMQLEQMIASGKAYEKFEHMVAAQGGSLDAARPIAPCTELLAEATGQIIAVDAEKMGWAVIAMGGGRRAKTDRIDPSVGFEWLVRLGDEVQAGQPLVRMFCHSSQREEATRLLRESVVIK
jgi:pyrimidine-nucleoside phosphorylase